MASGINPGMILAALQGRTSQGQSIPGQGAAQQSGAQDPGDAYASQVSALKGADPGMRLRQIKQLQKIVGVMIVETMETMPNVSSKLAAVFKTFDPVVKELQQASNVNAAVRNPTPQINMGAAQPPPDSQMGPAGMGGMMGG